MEANGGEGRGTEGYLDTTTDLLGGDLDAADRFDVDGRLVGGGGARQADAHVARVAAQNQKLVVRVRRVHRTGRNNKQLGKTW